jgi:hypothetical protein
MVYTFNVLIIVPQLNIILVRFRFFFFPLLLDCQVDILSYES